MRKRIKTIKDNNSPFSYYGFSPKEAKKYPVISRILRQLTPERIKREVEAIQRVKLPPELQKWVKEYEKVGERDEFIWKWIYNAMQILTLPIVNKRYKRSLWTIKTCSLVIFDILLNDAADKMKNKRLLDELIEIPFLERNLQYKHLDQKEIDYLFFTKKIWGDTLNKIKHFPRYKELKDIFYYDISQILVAIRYDFLTANYPYLINKTESLIYPLYTMSGMLCGTLDLMCSPKFKKKELGKIREVIWHAQKMARIGNWVSTWEREIEENDFTSGVFAYALANKVINIEDLKKDNHNIIYTKIKRSLIEKEILNEWEQSYKKVSKLSQEVNSGNFEKFLSGLEKLIVLELSSRKYK